MPIFVPHGMFWESCFLLMKAAAVAFPIPPAILPPENLDNLGTWVSLPTPCVAVCVCVCVCHGVTSVQDTSQGFLFDPLTLEPNMDGISFSEAIRHMQKLWQARGPSQTANRSMFTAWWLTHTQDWQSIWNFTSNKPGNFCRDTKGKDNLPSSVILFPDCRVSSISRLPEFVQSKACRERIGIISRKSIIRIHRKTSPV